jgi:hypothetical protein
MWDLKQPYRPPRPVTGIALINLLTYLLNISVQWLKILFRILGITSSNLVVSFLSHSTQILGYYHNHVFYYLLNSLTFFVVLWLCNKQPSHKVCIWQSVVIKILAFLNSKWEETKKGCRNINANILRCSNYEVVSSCSSNYILWHRLTHRTANPKALASILAPRSACQILATCSNCSSCL